MLLKNCVFLIDLQIILVTNSNICSLGKSQNVIQIGSFANTSSMWHWTKDWALVQTAALVVNKGVEVRLV